MEKKAVEREIRCLVLRFHKAPGLSFYLLLRFHRGWRRVFFYTMSRFRNTEGLIQVV